MADQVGHDGNVKFDFQVTYLILILVGLLAGLLSGAVGFGGGMVLLPVITYFYGVEVAVPVSTIAQLVSNLSRVGMGWKQISWKAAGQFLLLAVPFTALGALGFAKFPKGPMTIVLCVFLIVFAILKLRGKMTLPHKPATMIVGGGVTGLINGLLSQQCRIPFSGPRPGKLYRKRSHCRLGDAYRQSDGLWQTEPDERKHPAERSDDRCRHDAREFHRHALYP